MDLTVAICTYRRRDLLEQTLESLCACEPPDRPWELLVIDNACEADIDKLVQDFADRLPVRYIPEPTTGASHARNRAVAEAKAAIVLFTDDDVTFDPQWLTRMWTAIEAQPGCRFWGGRVEPVWTTPQPRWFQPRYFPMLADTIVQYDGGGASRRWRAASDPPFYTANLALRADAMRDAGGFDTSVGHRGDKRMGMEDSLMVRAIAAAGGEGWYESGAVVYHPVPAERTQKRYARQFVWRQGWLSARMTRRRSGDGFGEAGKMPRWFYRVAITELLSGAWKWFVGLVTFNGAKRFAGELRVRFNLSRLRHAGKASDGHE